MEKNLNWWKKALIYQIYPLSFKDSNNDGIGDIKGIISKLDYLKDFGVDVIWLSPVYESPMDDNGYDVSNYLAINPMFGTMEDMDELIKQVHKKDMKIIMDLVVNHTSDEYAWFKEAKENKHSKYRDYYIWNNEPVPNIQSIFSGSAWEYNEKTKDYYFHLFSKKQPDLNWQNPKLREEIYHIINTWLDKGIDGFRMDVIELIGKDIKSGRLGDGPYLETFMKEMYDKCFKGRDIMTVGEMNGLSVDRAQELTARNDIGLSMTFQFGHLAVDEVSGKNKWHIVKPDNLKLKHILSKNNEIFKKGGWNALFLSNHDQPRQVTRFTDGHNTVNAAQMLFTMSLLHRGTPYIYQGEEIGMTGIKFDNIKDYKDIETINWYHEAKNLGWKYETIMESIYAKGRDNSRTPFQWDDTKYAGFSKNEPWLTINPNYLEINAKKEMNNPKGVYQYTKALMQLRKKYETLITGDFELLFPQDEKTFIFRRFDKDHSFLIITNLVNEEVEVDLSSYKNYESILDNQDIKISKHTRLKPYAAAIFKEKL